MEFKHNDYLDFNTTYEANAWINKHYKDWLEYLQNEKDVSGSAAQCFFLYSGFGNRIYNSILREQKKPSKNEYKVINSMINELRTHKIPENIIVYRYVDKRFFSYLFKDRSIKVGECFSDKAILSTTMLKNELLEFASQNHCDCLLRLYLPKDTVGVFVQFKSSCLREYEILLTPNTAFRLVKKRFGFPRPVYDCILVSQ